MTNNDNDNREENEYYHSDEQSSTSDDNIKEASKEGKKRRTISLRYALILLIVILLINSIWLWSFFQFVSLENPFSSSEKQSAMVKFNKIFDDILNNYYKEVDEQKLIEGAIEGMVNVLDDPYSEYMDPETTKSFLESISGEFEGIGIELNFMETPPQVMGTIKGSPAEKIGIKANDILKKIDGAEVEDMDRQEIMNRVRGEEGSEVELTIEREGMDNPLTFQIVRAKISIASVEAKMLDDNIGHIEILTFGENTTKEFNAALKEMEKADMKYLVLDLRGNTGGLLETAIEISEHFVPNNKTILQIKDRSGKSEVIKASATTKLAVPTVVLIDGGSASASEVVTAALQESAGIKVVGANSFGKGTMQTSRLLNYNSEFKLTTAKWLTPSGDWINEKGITPDYVVESLEEKYFNIINPDEAIVYGTNSEAIQFIKFVLAEKDYNIGEINDNFDDKMLEAVKQFQSDSNLEATGVIEGETTWQLLYSIREFSKKDDVQLQKALEVVR